MTESSLLTAAGDAQPDEVPGEDRRRVVVAVGVLLSVGLCAGGWLLLTSSSDADDGLPPAPAAAVAVPTPSASATPVTEPVTEPVAPDGRNPFRALYTPPEAVADVPAGGGSTAPAGPAVAGPAVAGPAVAGPAVAGPAGQSPVTAPAAGGSEAPGPSQRVLALVRVEGTGEIRTAVFTLDGAEVRVAVGDSFGSTGQLLLLSLQEADGGAWTAVVQLGTGDPFDVVTGQPHTLP